MKLGMQSGSAFGTAVTTSGPAILPTHPSQPLAKLVVKSELGQVVQQWLILQNKSTLGSASSCALRCQLPGIAAYHALLVIGARQVFIRALAPKMSRNGVMVNELLLTEEQSSFEVAGHQFELIRDFHPRESTPAKKTPLGRMKFAIARPMEIGQSRSDSIPSAPTLNNTVATNPSIEMPTAAVGPIPTQWISELIQNAVQPLERQLSDLIEPLALVQHELERKARRKKEARKSTPRTAVASTSVNQPVEFTTQIDVQPQVAKLPETVTVPVISPIVEQMLAQQSYSLTTLGDRLVDLKSDLSSLERIVTEIQASQDAAEDTPVVPLVSPVVEAQMSMQSESLRKLEDELRGLSGSLDSLQQAVNHGFASAANSIPTIDLTPVDRAITQISSLADQLQSLSSQVEGLKSSVGSLEKAVEGNVAATKEIAAIPPAATPEAIQQLSNVLDQLGQLIREMHARQIAGEGDEQSWRDELRSQLDTIQNTRPIIQPTVMPTVIAPQAIPHVAPQATNFAPIANPGEQPTVPNFAQQTEVAKSSKAIQEASAAQIAAQSTSDQWLGFPSQREVNPFDPTSGSPALPQQNISVESQSGFSSTSEDARSLPADERLGERGFAEPAAKQIGNDLADNDHWAAAQKLADDLAAKKDSTHDMWAARTPEISPSEETSTGSPMASEVATRDSSNSTWAANSVNPIADHPIAADYDAGIIEEIIEQSPAPSVAITSELPSWWTDDDKSQFEDDSRASAAISSTWNLPSAERTIEDYDQPAVDSKNGSFADAIDDGNAVEDIATYSDRPGTASPWSLEASPSSADPIEDVAQENGSTIAGIPFGEIERGGNERKSESEELDSLLARFGLARQTEPEAETKSEVTASNMADASPFGLDRDFDESEPVKPFQGSSGFSSADLEDLDEDTTAAGAMIESRFEEQIAESDPRLHDSSEERIPLNTTAHKPSVSNVEDESDEEESIEDYMKRLMARMRGDSDKEESKPVATSTPVPAASKAESAVTSQVPKQPLPAAVTERANSTTTPFNPEEYVPKALAPEKSRNLAAMRELANNSARSAIQVSARRRYGTAIAMKLAIALTGLIVGGALIMINGFNVNIALIATIASFLVAVIWGIDAVGTIKPLLYTAKTTEADKISDSDEPAKE